MSTYWDARTPLGRLMAEDSFCSCTRDCDQERAAAKQEIERLRDALRNIRDPTVFAVGRNLTLHELERELNRVQDLARSTLVEIK